MGCVYSNKKDYYLINVRINYFGGCSLYYYLQDQSEIGYKYAIERGKTIF